MKTYEYILLDWDGNLAKTLDIWLDVYRKILKKRGIQVTDREIATGFGAAVEWLADHGVSDIQTAISDMDSMAKKNLPDVELYPDALEVIENLKARGKKLALITSSRHENVIHLLKKYNIARYFDVVVASDDVEHRKPHPEPLEKALELLGGTKEKAVMIGDSDKDLGASLNAGIDSILFYPEEHEKFYELDELKNLEPTYIIDDFREVLKIVGN